jgi:mycofactocin radical SAM maturase
LKQEFLSSKTLSAPVNVTWEITGRCNLNCRHCLSAGTAQAHAGDLSLEQCRRFIDHLNRIKVFQVNIGGGEPLLREDLLEILDYCHLKGIVTCISTNGVMLDNELAKKLARMPLTYVQISIDGATPETNDRIRGEGSYARALQGVECLTRQGLRNLSINTVVLRVNFREIHELYRLARFYGAKTRLSRFRPAGRAREAWQEYHLTKQQILELSAYLSEYKDVLTGDSFFSITAEDRKNLGLNMCGAAKMTCCVAPDGSVYPCAFLQESYFYAGNVLEQPLEEIWRRAGSFNLLRSLKKEACTACPRFDLCHGGCPAVAFFLKQELDCPDPECIRQISEQE